MANEGGRVAFMFIGGPSSGQLGYDYGETEVFYEQRIEHRKERTTRFSIVQYRYERLDSLMFYRSSQVIADIP